MILQEATQLGIGWYCSAAIPAHRHEPQWGWTPPTTQMPHNSHAIN